MTTEYTTFIFASLKKDIRYWIAIAAKSTDNNRSSNMFIATGTVLATAKIDNLEKPFKFDGVGQFVSTSISPIPMLTVFTSIQLSEIIFNMSQFQFDLYPSYDDLLTDHFVELL